MEDRQQSAARIRSSLILNYHYSLTSTALNGKRKYEGNRYSVCKYEKITGKGVVWDKGLKYMSQRTDR